MRPGILKLSAYMVRLGESLFTLKTILSCANKLSKKSRYLFSLFAWGFSYGQISQKQTRNIYVYQEGQIGQSVSMTNNNPRKANSFINWILAAKSQFVSNSFLQTAQQRISNSLFIFWQNKRLRTGIILLLIIAPLSRFAYLAFPKEGFGEYFINNNWITIKNFIESEEWIFQTLYWWFWSNGEIWGPIISIIGIFLLFPMNYYPSYLTGIPFGYYLSLLINRMFATNNTEVVGGSGYSMLIVYLIFGVILFAVSDKILFNTNHRKRAIDARILGLINMPGMAWEEKEGPLKKEARKAMKENNEIFSKAS